MGRKSVPFLSLQSYAGAPAQLTEALHWGKSLDLAETGTLTLLSFTIVL